MDAVDDLSAKEPDVPHRGLNVDDFSHPGVVRAVRQGVRLLPADKRRQLVLAGVVQVSLGLLDLLGIALIGLVAAVAVSGIGVTTIPDWLAPSMQRVGLGGLTVSQLSVVIALAAVTILVLKTVLSALLSRGIIRFLAARQSEVSVRLAREFLSRPLAQVQRWTMPEATYALGAGVGAATISLLGSSSSPSSASLCLSTTPSSRWCVLCSSASSP